MKTLYDLTRAVACKLAGREVIVSLDPPPYKGRPGHTIRGAAYLNSQGVPVIHIPPDLTEDGFSVLCHEAAHVREHAAIFPTVKDPWPLAEMVTAARDPGHAAREDEADKLAAGWLKIARRHSREIPGAIYESLLWAIWKFYE
jgi:hypothetical protein